MATKADLPSLHLPDGGDVLVECDERARSATAAKTTTARKTA